MSFRGIKGTPPNANSDPDASFGMGAEVRLCDYDQAEADLPPGPDSEFFGLWTYCQVPVDGASITASSEDGEVIGSCVTVSQNAAQNGVVNSCTIPGFTYTTAYEATLDESSIPDDFTIVGYPVTLEIGTEIPGGGETFPISFHDDKGDESLGGNPDVDPGKQDGLQAGIAVGSCGDTLAVETNFDQPALEAGPPVGDPDSAASFVSMNTIELSLDVLIDEPHSVFVYMDGEALLCGNIGGVDNDDWTLRIVLETVGTSGFGGLATLSYNQADSESTDVVIYVIPLG